MSLDFNSMKLGRPFPEVKVRHNVVCQSDRHGAPLLLGVIHDTEGGNIPHSSRDLVGLGDFFDQLSTQASSTVANDQDGHSARYVPDGRKAWHVAFYNPWALGIEQIGFATDNWNSIAKADQLRETARWLARWHRLHSLPLRQARVTVDGQIKVSGVCQHRGLGRLGGGHHDVNENYPLHGVIILARRYVPLQNAHAKEWEDNIGREVEE